MTPAVLCAGSIVLDTIVRPVTDLRWGTTTFVESMTKHVGGNGANTALALARLGCPVRLLGAVGDDEAAMFVQHALRTGGVDISRITHTTRPNAATMVLVHIDGQRQFLHRFGASEQAFADPLRFDSKIVGEAVHFHLASLFVLPHLRHRAPGLLQAAREAGLSTSLDVNWDARGEWIRVLEPCLPHADTLFLNEDESRMLTGSEDAYAAAAKLHALGASLVVQKRGPEGCVLCPRGGTFTRVPGFQVNVFDTTGAGDCFAAAFLRSYLRGDGLQTAARHGNAAGALSVAHIGAVDGLPDAAGFESWLHREH